MPFLESHTHVAIFLVILLDTVGLPIPGEVFLLAAGFLVSAGRASFLPTALMAAAGAVLGDAATFGLGRLAGQGRLMRLYATWNGCTLASHRCRDDAESLVRRFRLRIVLVAKFIPGARVFVPPLAGASSQSLAHFLWLDAAASRAWTALGVTLGMMVGREWERSARSLEEAYRMGGLGVAFALSVHLGWKLQRRYRYGAAGHRPSVEGSPSESPVIARVA
jgi:membrane protein DedA with SNARE-associated domain